MGFVISSCLRVFVVVVVNSEDISVRTLRLCVEERVDGFALFAFFAVQNVCRSDLGLSV